MQRGSDNDSREEALEKSTAATVISNDGSGAMEVATEQALLGGNGTRATAADVRWRNLQ